MKVRGRSRIRSCHLGKKIDFFMSAANELILAKRLLAQVVPSCQDPIVKERIVIFLKIDSQDPFEKVDDEEASVGDARDAQ
ncbi:hypothetical protein UFOVP736_5 [uncultured Caudovirales phage]|uniref:Uncharacterized protein n=1 Tax=uncultured Caudovirales phage TaxID=2100421 RepID=A0A6J7WZU5_9CAUD|nr:hypothetical protein UFOVP705_76 [uncultured Caudovirales phage]CAB5223725.1 hypothetical protein UFOVP736_5 [uncultured Caudovirales phage]